MAAGEALNISERHINVPKRIYITLYICANSGGGPIHARVPIQAHPRFSLRFIIFHGEDVYHIIDNHQMHHLHL